MGRESTSLNIGLSTPEKHEALRLERQPVIRQFAVKTHGRCDLACDHCYVYESADKSVYRKPTIISPKVAQQTAERIAEHVKAHQIPETSIRFHGGEPTLIGPRRLAELAEIFKSTVPGEVCLSIQTNGMSLTNQKGEPNLAFMNVFKEHHILVGVSLDGGREANDRLRKTHGGQGSYDRVVRGIQALQKFQTETKGCPELFGYLLCTINLDNEDSLQVYRDLKAHRPPQIDFLLPHHTWERPPASRTMDPYHTPYADWLNPIFDEYIREKTPVQTRVRLFDALIGLLQGKRGPEVVTESLGLEPMEFAIVETDGTLEQTDALKEAFEGAAATGYNVKDHTIDQMLQHPGIQARMKGREALGAACQQCRLVETCGGGLYAHRYRHDYDDPADIRNFQNPSAYCPDLMAVIAHAKGQYAEILELAQTRLRQKAVAKSVARPTSGFGYF